MPIDPQIDVVHSLGLTAKRSWPACRTICATLKRLLRGGPQLRHSAAHPLGEGPCKLRRQPGAKLRKAIRLIEELSPRTELLDALAEEMTRTTTRWPTSIGLANKPARRPACANSAPAPSRSCATSTEMLATPEEMSGCSRSSAGARQSIPARAPRVGRGQPAAGGVDRQELSRPRPVVRRPDPGRQSRPDAGGRQVRAPPGLQVRHLRHLVDSPGHPAGLADQPARCACRAIRSACWRPSSACAASWSCRPAASRPSRRSPRCSAPAPRRRGRCGPSRASRSACTSRWATTPSGP